MRKLTYLLLFIIFSLNIGFAQKTIYEPLNLDKVKFSFDDFGSMWTFDAVPLKTYQQKYNFKPDKKWLDHVQKSALQFSNGCSGAFVSADGLIMTNHHCVRGALGKVQKEGENIHRDGFYAENIGDERPFPGLFVDQLIEIKDVSQQIFDAMENGKTNDEKIEIKEKTIKEIENTQSKKTGLVCKVITLYKGGKYSLYCYKRYSDIRLVMVPDVQIAATGWDWDNFTYPRYELDFAFLRAYDENGKPVKIENHFTWSKKGANEGEPIFVIGRPGNTDRLLSVKQLEFFKDITYPLFLLRFNEIYHSYYKHFEANPDRQAELLGRLLSVANGRKYFAGLVMALNDDYIMTKKNDFEKDLRNKVKNDSDLKKKYGNIWDDIDKVIESIRKYEKEFSLYRYLSYYGPSTWKTATKLAVYQLQASEKERKKSITDEKIDFTLQRLFVEPEEKKLDILLIQSQASFLNKAIGEKCVILRNLFNGKTGKEASDYYLKNTKLDDKEFVKKLLQKGENAIEESDDPLLKEVLRIQKRLLEIRKERTSDYNTLDVLNQQLGRLIFDAYGEQIPPDATSTLRISHGEIKQYEYNGTIAPGKSTYYGLYDRYFAFGEKDYPWGLHPRWKKPPKGLDLSIPVCYASTNDIVGGNSGSSMINAKGEVIGLVHDGNLESLAGAYIFLEENNRAVATDSWGLMEALIHVYKTKRLVDELKNSKIK